MQFKTRPYEHQQVAFDRFKDSTYFGLFMDMGVGKTKIVIDIASYRYLKGEIDALLVIAPNNVHIQWIKEQFPIHCSIPYYPFIWRSGKSGNKYYRKRLDDFLNPTEGTDRLKVFCVNVEAFQANTILKTIAEYVKNHKCLIVIDEATRIKNSGAKRSKIIHKLNKYGSRCILTGTPTAKSPFDLWSQMEFLKANYFGCTYFIFQHRYGVMMTGVNEYTGGHYQTLIDEKKYSIARSKIKKVKAERNGHLMPNDYEALSVILGISEKNVKYIEEHETFQRYKRLDELKDYIQGDVFAIKKEDCLDLPPKVYERVYVEMSKEQRRIYDQLKKQLLAQYMGKELTIFNKVALMMRLMQISGGFFPYTEEIDSRLPRQGTDPIKKILKSRSQMIGSKNVKGVKILEELEEIDPDEQVIVWAHFRVELEYLQKELTRNGYDCRLYYGGTSQDKRQEIIDNFKQNRFKIFIGNPAVAGFGLNLQTATTQLWFSNSFRTEDRLQAEDRSHRIGVQKTCVYKDIVCRDSVDENIYKNLQEGKNLNDYFKSSSLKELLK